MSEVESTISIITGQYEKGAERDAKVYEMIHNLTKCDINLHNAT